MYSHLGTGYGGASSSYSVSRNQKAKLAADYQELLKELSSPKVKSVGNYILGEDLGEGTYGKVKLATHRLTGQRVAIKIIPKTNAENLTREIHHHRYLHHPNIISLLEVIPTESKIYMVLEYCEGGELYDFLVNAGGRLKENLAKKMFGQLCRAVKYCHDRRVVHRDLKLENILLDAQNNVKLGDFGFTRECEVKKLLETICGSIGYSAPEMLAGKKYSGQEADIWSLGVILYTLLCGELPFDDEDDGIMKSKIIKGEYVLDKFLSDEANNLIRSILQLDPTERPTLKQILQHTWFTMKDEEEEEDDQWDTSEDVGDNESISSIEETYDEGTTKDFRDSSISHLERQRQELFTATRQNTENASPLLPSINIGTSDNALNPYSRFNGITQTPSSSPPKQWGPSTSSKASRRSSIDSKAFNEKVFFTTPDEKELLKKLESLGFDVAEMKKSVLEGKCDSSSGLWWLLLGKLREKRKCENQNPITMVDVAVGTNNDEAETTEEVEEEEHEIVSIESPTETDNSRPSQESEEEKVPKITKVHDNINIVPPTPPPKIYRHERRRSLVLSHPEAVEPVLTTITATASPPLSPKKYQNFTSPISSRSVSPIPTTTMPMPIKTYRKKGFISTIKGWWGGAGHHPKEGGGGGYKKPAVVHSDYPRRRSGSKTPPNHDLSRRSSSISRNSMRDKKKKRNSLQGSKGRRSNQLSPLMIAPVTPSVVLSQNSPAMLPIPGTPPARSKTMFTINRRKPFAYPGSSWGRKTVKRQSTGSSINIPLENFNAEPSSSGSHNNLKDTFEKSAIEKSSDDVQSIMNNENLTIDEQSRIVESSKLTLASPPPTPPPPPSSSPSDKVERTTKSTLLKKSITSRSQTESPKVDESSSRVSSDEEDDSDVFVDASDFTSHARSRSPSPSPSTSPSSNSSPIIKPDGTIVNPPSFPVPPSRPIKISPPPWQSSTTSPIPFSPPSSPTEDGVTSSMEIPVIRGRAPPINDGLRLEKSKQPESTSNILEKTLSRAPLDLLSTPPESPELSPPPSKPSTRLKHQKSSSHDTNRINSIGIDDGKVPNDVDISNTRMKVENTLRRDSSPSPPNASYYIFRLNNGLPLGNDRAASRRGGSINNTVPRHPSSLPNRESAGNNIANSNNNAPRRPSLAKRPQGAIIEEEEEEEENDDMEE